MLAENAAGSRCPLIPVGGRTGLRLGGAAAAEARVLLTSEFQQVIDYPADDMTITVEAGLRVDELNTLLAGHSQRLPIDVAQSHRATIGGAIAANTSGPGRFGHGTFRDYVIGISAVDGQGRCFSAGGRVVKNVAGYDLCKLLTGSQGTLAVITQVTLKLRPLVECRTLAIAQGFTPAQADQILTALNVSATRPVAIELLNSKAARQLQRDCRLPGTCDGLVLIVGFEGRPVEVDWQMETLQAELASLGTFQCDAVPGAEATRVWRALTEYQAASDDPLTFQMSVRPSGLLPVLEQATSLGIAVQAHAGNGIILGHLPDRCATAEAALDTLKLLQPDMQAASGHLTILNCDQDWRLKFGDFGESLRPEFLHQQVKQALDPENIFSRGRWWP